MNFIRRCVCPFTWWRHQMETFSALLALCAGTSPVSVTSPHTGQWRGALMFSLICAWIKGWVNNHEAGDLRRHRGHYDVSVMIKPSARKSSRIALIIRFPVNVHDLMYIYIIEISSQATYGSFCPFVAFDVRVNWHMTRSPEMKRLKLDLSVSVNQLHLAV